MKKVQKDIPIFLMRALGAIDGSHIHLAAPSFLHNACRNRKGFTSQNCLFACSFNFLFVILFSLYTLITIFPYWVYPLFGLSIWSSDVAIFLRCTDSPSTSVLYQSLRCKSYSYFVILQLLIVSSILLICLSGIPLSALPITEVILLICLSVRLRVPDHPLYSTGYGPTGYLYQRH
jgi:hypothetical protein